VTQLGYILLFFFKNKVINETGRVLQVRANGFSVLIPKYGIEGKVYLINSIEKSEGMWKYDGEKKKSHHLTTNTTYKFLTKFKFKLHLMSHVCIPLKLYFCALILQYISRMLSCMMTTPKRGRLIIHKTPQQKSPK